AEGLLMYLPSDIFSLLMRTLKGLSSSGSQFTFTFMEKQSDGRIRFHSQSKLVDCWLRGRGEPFVWGTTRDELVDLMRPWRVIRFFDHDDLRRMESGLADEAIATGEVICLAEINLPHADPARIHTHRGALGTCAAHSNGARARDLGQ